MVVDVASKRFSFGFAPGSSGTFSEQNKNGEDELYLQNLSEEASNATVSEICPSNISSSGIVATALSCFRPPFTQHIVRRVRQNCLKPRLRSWPYRCAPPKLPICRKMVDLLEQDVVRQSARIIIT